MADHYSLFSKLVEVPEDAGKWLIDRIDNYEDDDGEAFVCNCKWLDEEGGVWLYSDENFNADYLADCLQHMLRKFNLDRVIAIEWAETCSKPRINCFGGGWIVVSRDDIDYGNTYSAADEAMEAMKTGSFRC